MRNNITILLMICVFGLSAQVPVVSPISGANTVCSMPSPGETFSVTATNSPTTYSWSVASATPGAVISNPTASITNISFPYSNGTYTISCYADNSFGSSLVQTKVVTVYETPTVTFSGANTFCQGSATFLSASATALMASPTISYNWAPPTGLNTTIGQYVTANPPTATIYTVTAYLGGCAGSSTIAVTPLPSPTVGINVSSTVVCQGNPVTLSGTGANTYSWNNSVTNNIPFYPLFTTLYTVTGYSTNGCSKTANIMINVNPAPSVSVSASSPTICQGQSAVLTIYGTAISYSVNNALSSTTVVVSPTVSTNYTITGSSNQGCIASDYLTIAVYNCMGFENLIKNESRISAYPNPGKQIKIKSDIYCDAILYDQLGRQVMDFSLQPDVELVISQVPPGVYYLRSGINSIKLIITDN